PQRVEVGFGVEEGDFPEGAEEAAAELPRLHLAALDRAVLPDLQLDRERGRAGEAVAVVGGGVAAEHVHGDLARAAGDGGGDEVLSGHSTPSVWLPVGGCLQRAGGASVASPGDVHPR